MSLSILLGGLLGKTVVGSVAKGSASKLTGAAVKTLYGKHTHHGVAKVVTRKAADMVTDRCIDKALADKTSDRT